MPITYDFILILINVSTSLSNILLRKVHISNAHFEEEISKLVNNYSFDMIPTLYGKSILECQDGCNMQLCPYVFLVTIALLKVLADLKNSYGILNLVEINFSL